MGHAIGPIVVLVLVLICPRAGAADQPQWGQAWSRNMVSSETNLPSRFDPATGENVKWVARLGTEAHSTPVVAHGRVYIGTNNGEPRDLKDQGDRGVLMCFAEESGELLWQLVVPKLSEDPYFDWPNSGISSPATVEGNRVYIVSNRGEVLCLDPEGMANGNDGPFLDESRHQTPQPPDVPDPVPDVPIGRRDADILWVFDMRKDAGIWSHDGAHSSILIAGDFLYLNTGTGVDNTHRKIRTPDAPSLIVLDKHSGRLLAREREKIAPRIFHCTWSAPSMGMVDGRKQIFFAAGNGILYGFELLEKAPPPGEISTLKKIWQFDPDPAAPKEDVHRYNSNRREGPSNMYGMPVIYEGILYFTGGGDLWWGKNEAWLKAMDPSGEGDLTTRAELWTFQLEKHVMSTPAISGELVFIADTGRMIYCLDRRSGKLHWSHELRGEIWASPYVADGKVFLGSRRGDFWIFAASREKQILGTVELRNPISATATAANRTLYIATMTHLYAVAVPGK